MVRVRRLPGQGEYGSLFEAVAKTQGPLIIEIHDQGPLFETSLPAVQGRSLWIRGGEGFRPLLAWDGAASRKDKYPLPFITLSEGNLTLENVDVVVKWTGGRSDEAGCMFAIQGGDFSARQCTFTLAGKNPRGLILVRAFICTKMSGN